ncbi:hypothetical protein [Vibrio sp. DNB22_19_1]
MSVTKRLVDDISNFATELQSRCRDKTWYGCLDEATLAVTNNAHHFKDLHPKFGVHLLRSPNDLSIAIKRASKKLVKTENIKHSDARQHVAMQWGFNDSEQFEKQVNDQIKAYQRYAREYDLLLQGSDSELELINTADEWLALPMFDDAFSEGKSCMWIHQLDYVKVPLEACRKRNIDAVLSQEGAVLLPYVRLLEPLSPDLPIKALRLPEASILKVIEWTYRELINDFNAPEERKYKLFITGDINPEVFVQTYVPSDKVSSRLRPYRALRLWSLQSAEICSECGLPVEECFCTYSI